MKIERLNENQIRCTLSKEDLVNREIKLSELAYGSDKAKRLFRDMMIRLPQRSDLKQTIFRLSLKPFLSPVNVLY